MTTLRPYNDPKSGKIRRVYVRRPGLKAYLWFEKSKLWEASFDVRFDATRGSFSVLPTSGEASHVAEARAALAEVGLDLTSCSWSDIVERAEHRSKGSQALLPWLAGRLPFVRRRIAS
jgi:hypothetical protein